VTHVIFNVVGLMGMDVPVAPVKAKAVPAHPLKLQFPGDPLSPGQITVRGSAPAMPPGTAPPLVTPNPLQRQKR
jgi:hypothetical protein